MIIPFSAEELFRDTRGLGGFIHDREAREPGRVTTGDGIVVVRTLTAGQIVIVASGQFSNYSIDSCLRVLREFDWPETLRGWCDRILAETGGLQLDETFPDEPNRWKEVTIRRCLREIAEYTALLNGVDEATAIKDGYARRIEIARERLTTLGYGIRPQQFYRRATLENFLKHLIEAGLIEVIDVFEFNWDVD